MKEKIKTKEIKFCPKCNSRNIGFEITDVYNANYCKDCGYNDRLKDIQKNIIFPTKSRDNKI